MAFACAKSPAPKMFFKSEIVDEKLFPFRLKDRLFTLVRLHDRLARFRSS